MVRSDSIHDNVVGSSCVPGDVTRTPCDLGGGLKAWWFMSDKLGHQAEASRFIFYVHGPTSSPGSSAHRALVSRLALEAGAAVLMVDYRRTPEHTREDSQADVSKAYGWLVGQPGVMPTSTLIMADGLGCALALNLCAELRDATVAGGEDVLPAGLGLLSPWVDLSDSGTFGSKSWEKHQQVDYLSQRIMAFTASGYAGLSQVGVVPRLALHARAQASRALMCRCRMRACAVCVGGERPCDEKLDVESITAVKNACGPASMWPLFSNPQI